MATADVTDLATAIQRTEELLDGPVWRHLVTPFGAIVSSGGEYEQRARALSAARVHKGRALRSGDLA